MQTDNERYRKMASLAQIGWWEVDLTAGYYLNFYEQKYGEVWLAYPFRFS